MFKKIKKETDVITNADLAKCDAETENGRIACTSWYEIIKGEQPMTEYTSL